MTKKELREVLWEVYRIHGPRTGYSDNDDPVPPEEYARMTDDEVNKWDFHHRFLLRRVAKAIVSH